MIKKISKDNLIKILFLIWFVFQMYANIAGTIPVMHLRIIHMVFLLTFATIFLEKTHISIKIISVILIVGTLGYIGLNYNNIAMSGGLLSNIDIGVAVTTLILAIIIGFKVCKNLTIIALVFLAYNFLGQYFPGMFAHSGFSVKRVAEHMVWGTQGIFGVGIGVSATYIYTFVLFGSFLKYSGFSEHMNNILLGLIGKKSGGPAKVSVLVSAILGMINGSAVANVATTGSVTIPLMKKNGYSSEFSGAVEAVASTGGQFTPPIMGAVGFVMAEFLGVSYVVVLTAAIIPAFLYYLALFLSVHFEAKKLGLKGLDKENIPNVKNEIKNYWHLGIPFVVLILMIALNFTPIFSAIIAMVSTVISSYFRKDTKMNFSTIIDAIVEGSKSSINIGISCILIGLIIGTVSLTSLGLTFGYGILQLIGNNHIYLGAIAVMLISIILGTGVPGVAAYVIVSTVAVPSLIEMGVMPISAHMFCLIYACLSNITPPVAMSSYIASGIAKSDMTKTSLIAIKLGIAGFILPIFFINNPILLLGATNPMIFKQIIVILTATFGIVALSAGSEGWLIKKCSLIERILLIIAGLMTIDYNYSTDVIGIIIFVAIIVIQVINKRKNMEVCNEQI